MTSDLSLTDEDFRLICDAVNRIVRQVAPGWPHYWTNEDTAPVSVDDVVALAEAITNAKVSRWRALAKQRLDGEGGEE